VVYILAVVEGDMIFNTDPLCDMGNQWFIYYNSILLKKSINACAKFSLQSFLHIPFINSVAMGGQYGR